MPTDPLILRALDAFARRRRLLIVLRGLCATLATLLVTMMSIALLDRWAGPPDAVRWGLSFAAYAAVIVAGWRACIRLLLRPPGPRHLARLIEHAAPHLREDLLSAVELGASPAGAAFDSAEFRALLQRDVARRLSGLRIESLLPVNRLRRPLTAVALTAAVCVVAVAVSGGQFGTLLLRALAPGANLERLSRVKVEILTPASPDATVPQGEAVPLLIALAGSRADSAGLELFSATGHERVAMIPAGPQRFTANIPIRRDDLLYRIRAGDALTRKHRLHPVARPRVVRFEKAVTFPAYTAMAPVQISDEHGDVAALEGSEVELRLLTDQRIREGELRIEQGARHSVIPLTTRGDALVATLPLDASGTYRVHLVAADTGFDNKFSPEYALRAEPDLVPRVNLEAPTRDLALPPDGIVRLQGTADDDQALARVLQLVKVNDGPWTEVPLAQEPGAQTAAVDRQWDLSSQGVSPGDRVTTKLVAFDRKGGRGESRTLQITILPRRLDTRQIEAPTDQRALSVSPGTSRTAAETLAETGKPAGAAPTLSERMAQLAAETTKLQQDTIAQAATAGEKQAGEAQADARHALARQQALNERVGALEDTIRAEAGRHDILSEPGREAVRDAADALALLAEPPPNAEAALAKSAQTPLPAENAAALQEAAREQEKLAAALTQLAQHFQNAGQGTPEKTRAALRATEAATGLKAAMEQQQQARTGQLASSPEELLKQMEAALPGKSPKSQAGAKSEASAASPIPPGAAGTNGAEWGRLPRQMADKLTRGRAESVAGEYRHQVETYYRVIAGKAKQP